jgi:enoyl-CoA hydratase
MSALHIKKQDHTLVITIDNPPMAMMSPESFEELATVVIQVNEDPEIGGVVLTSTHPTRFLAGFDVDGIVELLENAPTTSPQEALEMLSLASTARELPGLDGLLSKSPYGGLILTERLHEILRSIQSSSAVWVAAINGSAMGMGMEIALACDIRYMAEGDFMIGQPEILLGLIPGTGGTQRLARLLGTSRALQLILDGGGLTPKEASKIGLVDKVIAPEELLTRAIDEANRLGRRPKTAIGASKRAVYEGATLTLEDGLRLESAEVISALGSADTLQAMRGYIATQHIIKDLPVFDQQEMQTAMTNGRFTEDNQ